MKTFKDRIKELRIGRNMRQEDLSNALQLKKQAVSNWERGIRFPEEPTLVKLADFFNVSLDFLLGRTDDPDIIILTNKDLHIPDKYKEHSFEIGVNKKVYPQGLSAQDMLEIIKYLEDSGFEFKRKKENKNE